MIYLDLNYANKVVLTLSESTTLQSPNYLFIFKRDWNFQTTEIAFTTDDESTHLERYNLFTIEENASGSTTGGTSVALSLAQGQWSYSIYEASASTLSVSATTGVVIESGRMVVGNFLSELNNGSVNTQLIP